MASRPVTPGGEDDGALRLGRCVACGGWLVAVVALACGARGCVCGPVSRFRQQADDVAFGIDCGLSEADEGELREQPGGALGFAEGRRRDADQGALPVHEQAVVKVKPTEGLMNTSLRG
jgi:hypothetical protein